MQLKRVLVLLLFATVVNLLVLSCKKSEDNPTDSGGAGESAVTQIGSLGSGSVSTPGGYKLNVIPGTVPANSSGGSGTVSFSIETQVTPPLALPSTVTRVSDFMKVGPDGFNFRWPVKVTIPFNASTDPQSVKVLYLDGTRNKWVIVPANEINSSAHTISIDVLTLGYFCAGTISSSFSKVTSDDADGGFEFATSDNSYYYTLTVGAVSSWKYPSQAAWYSNIVGSSGSTGSTAGGGTPYPPTHIHLPQATYQIWVTRTTPGTLSTLPKVEYYTQPVTGTIGQPVTYSGPLSTGQGWTSLGFPTGGSWSTSLPPNWLQPTITYGTGEFQATLTWLNASGSDTDIDLHLYGPNSMHVYYGNMTSSDNTVQLDRDWQRSYGNAVENIYSVSSMPSGSYSIYANLYVGDNHDFSVRIIRAGTVKTYTGSVSTANSANDQSKMVLVTTFTK